MTHQPSPSGGQDTTHLVAQAERQLAAAGETLDAVLLDIKAGKFGTARETSAAVTALRKALEAVFSERAKLEKLSQDDTTNGPELDLEKAFAEVRRRMARLRAIYGSGDVSETTDD